MTTATESKANHAFVRRLDAQGAAGASKTQRIPALDFTKGALVLLMVLYHWVNYFIGPQWEYYKYLRFLTPSFIFITGFMISSVYLSKYSAADVRLSRRLFTRGLKLIAIFVLLNGARTVVVRILGTDVRVRSPLDVKNIFNIFVSGNIPIAGGKLVAFSILVSISYLLLLSGMLTLSYRVYRYTFHLVSVVLLLAIFMLGLVSAHSPNLEFITIGMLGVLTGFMPMSVINDFVGHPYLLAFAYLGYAIAITIWNVTFPLLIVGVVLSLSVIFCVGVNGGKFDKIRSRIIQLGKYSLFAYISQVAILQILSATFRHFNLGIVMLGISFIAAFALTIMSVEVVDCARGRTASFDSLYRAVFG